MNDTIKNKDKSALVQSVLALDEHITQLERLSTKIDEMKLNSDSDFEQVRKLMGHFAEHGKAVGTKIAELAKHLNDARMRAENAASLVSAKSELLQARRDLEEQKMEAFRALAEKVQILGQGIAEFKKPAGEILSEDDRAALAERLADFDSRLQPLIEEAQTLHREAQDSKMKGLESQASSLTQNLLNVREKVARINQSSSAIAH